MFERLRELLFSEPDPDDGPLCECRHPKGVHESDSKCVYCICSTYRPVTGRA